MQLETTLFKKSFASGLELDPDYTVTEWADNNLYISKSSGAASYGKYSSDKTPYLREIMDNLTKDSGVTTVVFVAGAQVGKTQTGLNWLGYVIDTCPCSMMFVFPTEGSAKKNSKLRIQTTIDDTPNLKAKVAQSKNKETLLQKEFKGGFLVVVGANSSNGLRSTPIRYLYLDEVDIYPQDLNGEGDPIALAMERQNTFGSKKKIFITSTPTIKHFSIIEKEYEKGDQRKYYVPCPQCKIKQTLDFRRIKYKTTTDKKGVIADSIYYECEHCNQEIKEHSKTWMLEQGEWRAENPNPTDPATRSYHLNSLYSPIGWKSWLDIVKQWLKAQDSPEELKTFINTVLGETWEAEGDRPDHTGIMERAEGYRLSTVPAKAVLLTAGIDIQKNRIAIQVVAWGENEESWVIDYLEIMGDTTQQDIWIQLNKYIRKPFPHESGIDLFIRRAAVDSGFLQNIVMDFVNANKDKYIAIRGDSQGQASIIAIKPNNVGAYHLGVDTIKEDIYARLKINVNQGTDRYIHFSEGLDEEYYKMLTAEKLVTKYVNGRPKAEWRKIYLRNESLDTFGYALATAVHLGIKRMNYKEIYEKVIGKKLEDLKPKVNIEEENDKKPTNMKDNFSKLVPKRVQKGGFVNKFR